MEEYTHMHRLAGGPISEGHVHMNFVCCVLSPPLISLLLSHLQDVQSGGAPGFYTE